MKSTIEVLNKCTECRLCVNECPFLTWLGKTPREVSQDLLGTINGLKTYPFSCFLCGLCKVVCPNKIDVPEMFHEARRALASKLLSSNTYYKLLLPDEEHFLAYEYKKRKKISYENLAPNRYFKYAFFPGCAMSYSSPKAILVLYDMLNDNLKDVGIIDLCCGKPIYDLGLTARATRWLIHRVIDRLRGHECKVVITACPNCYYYLKHTLTGEFKVVTIYELLLNELRGRVEDLVLTIHDSCPDRFNGLFAKLVREILSGCKLIEMEHSKERTICCGSGGLVSCISPQLTLSLINIRINEAIRTGAQIMTVYCYNCAISFWSVQPSIEVKHVLNLVLKVEDESEAIKQGELTKIALEVAQELR